MSGDRATGVDLVDLASGTPYQVAARQSSSRPTACAPPSCYSLRVSGRPRWDAT